MAAIAATVTAFLLVRNNVVFSDSGLDPDAWNGAALAFDASNGDLLWHFWGAPGPGVRGNDTWEGDSWQTGGATPWIHPAVDPEAQITPVPSMALLAGGVAGLFAPGLTSIVAAPAATDSPQGDSIFPAASR